MRRAPALFVIFLGLAAAACTDDATGDGSDNGGDNGGGTGGGGGGGGGGGDGSGVDMGDDLLGDGTGPDVADDDTQPTYPTEHPRIYLRGPHKARLQAALAANTPAATRFRTTVDQWVNGANHWAFKGWNGALLGALTDDPKYCTKAIATVEQQVTAAEAAIAAGKRPEVSLNSYLHVGDMIGDLSLTYDWCFGALTQSQRDRWIAYGNQTIANLWNHTGATWGGASHPWLGWSVDSPENNYYYSFLRATALFGLATKHDNPRADEWIAQFRDTKFYGQLVPAFEANLIGGGSREGTGYGVSLRGLFELYSMWHATTGENLATKTKHARATLRAFVHQTMPTLDKVAPTGDHARDMTAAFFDYHRHLLQTLIALFPDDPYATRAKQLLASSNVKQMSERFMQVFDFLHDYPDVPAQPLDGVNTAYYAPGIGALYARSGWGTDATWVNLLAGPFTESHAHEDQGSIMIYKGGWLAYDAVINSQNGLPQGTHAHGLVRISNGGTTIKQARNTASKLASLQRGDGWLYAAADLTPAYKGNAAIQKVHREMVYLAPDAVIVFDRVTTAGGTTQTWQLPTPVQPQISGNTATIANAGHQLRITRLAPTTGSISAYDLSREADLRGGWRVDETQPGGDHRYLHVLGIDNAVTQAAAAGDAANPGATVTLSDGRTVTVTFDRDQIGATLTIDGQQVPLTPGVATLAE